MNIVLFQATLNLISYINNESIISKEELLGLTNLGHIELQDANLGSI